MGNDAQSAEGDAGLLVRLQAGELAAFDVLFERHRRGVRAYAAAILRDGALAEDVVQECFLELARRAGELDPKRGVTGWLYRVARNRAIDVQRRRSPEVRPGGLVLSLLRDDQEQAPSAAEVLLEREREMQVTAALATLPEAERDVLTLHFVAGLAYREVSEMMERPLGTVLWFAQRGLGRLRKTLGARLGR